MRDYITDEHRAVIAAATGQPCTDALLRRFLARIPEHIARREAKRKAIYEAAQADYPRKARKWAADRKLWFERFTEIADWEERKQSLDAMQASLPKLPDKAAMKAMHMRLKQLGDRPAEIESEPQPPKAPEPLRAETEEEAWLHLMADMAGTLSAPLLPAPDALMADYGPVGTDEAPYPGVPDDFVQLMTGDETLEQAVERMTLGVDELLDMATVLSDPSLELALCTVPPERVNEWTEKLITEKARLRRLRGTVDENFGRENLVSRVQGMFAQVGAKR